MILTLSVYSQDGVIVREGNNCKSIYGTWDAVFQDIPNMKYFSKVIIKIY